MCGRGGIGSLGARGAVRMRAGAATIKPTLPDQLCGAGPAGPIETRAAHGPSLAAPAHLEHLLLGGQALAVARGATVRGGAGVAAAAAAAAALLDLLHHARPQRAQLHLHAAAVARLHGKGPGGAARGVGEGWATGVARSVSHVAFIAVGQTSSPDKQGGRGAWGREHQGLAAHAQLVTHTPVSSGPECLPSTAPGKAGQPLNAGSPTVAARCRAAQPSAHLARVPLAALAAAAAALLALDGARHLQLARAALVHLVQANLHPAGAGKGWVVAGGLRDARKRVEQGAVMETGFSGTSPRRAAC